MELLKKLFKNQKTVVASKENIENSRVFNYSIQNIISVEGLTCIHAKNSFPKIKKITGGGWGGQNALELINGNGVLLYPHNDGGPTCPYVNYMKVDGNYKEVMNNQDDFTKQIINLDECLIRVVSIMDEAYKKNLRIVHKKANSFSCWMNCALEPQNI